MISAAWTLTLGCDFSGFCNPGASSWCDLEASPRGSGGVTRGVRIAWAESGVSDPWAVPQVEDVPAPDGVAAALNEQWT